MALAMAKWFPGAGDVWVRMCFEVSKQTCGLCDLLAGPSVVLFPSTERFGRWGDGVRQHSPCHAN